MTDHGEPPTEADVVTIKGAVDVAPWKRPSAVPAEASSAPPEAALWDELLPSTLSEIKPDAFERLCQRVLRESGFINVTVTGRSGDGGIDGIGVLRMNLVSSHVLFQCKR